MSWLLDPRPFYIDAGSTNARILERLHRTLRVTLEVDKQVSSQVEHEPCLETGRGSPGNPDSLNLPCNNLPVGTDCYSQF